MAAKRDYPSAFWKSYEERPAWAEEASPEEWFTRWVRWQEGGK